MPDTRAPSVVDRVRMALAEMGYPDHLVTDHADGPSVALGAGGVPDAVCWRVFAVAGDSCCWPCWQTGDGLSCTHPVVLSDAPLPERPKGTREA